MTLANSERTGGRTQPFVAALVVLSVVALLAPIAAVAVPPLLDYPNHFTRFWMMAGGLREAPLDRIYAVDWSRASINVAGDLIAVTLGPLVGRENIGRVVLAFAVLLPPLGAVLLHRRLYGSFSVWQIAFTFPAWSLTLLEGFMNFHIGLGVALLSAALDGTVARMRPALAFLARALLCGAALVCHPFGALFYAALVMALAYGPLARLPADWPAARALAGRLLLPAAACVTPVVLFVVSRHAPVGAGQVAPFFQWAPFTLGKKASVLSSGLRSYHTLVDGLALGSLVLIPLVAALRRALSVHVGLLASAALLAIAAACMPTRIGGTFAMDYRLPIMALFAFILAVRPRFARAPVLGAAAAGVLAALSFVRTGFVVSAWRAGEADIAALHRVVGSVEPGAAILAVMHTPPDRQKRLRPWRYPAGKANFWNYDTLVVPWRHAFAPNVFAQGGQQPLRVLPPWQDISTPYGPPLRTNDLYVAPRDPAFAYARHWRSRFDYLLLLNADLPDAGAPPLPRRSLDLVADEGFAVLYRIRRDAPAEAAKAP